MDTGGHFFLISLGHLAGDNGIDPTQAGRDIIEEFFKIEGGSRASKVQEGKIRFFEVDHVFHIFEGHIRAQVNRLCSPAFEDIVHK